MSDRLPAAGAAGDARLGPAGGEGVAEAAAVTALAGDQGFGVRQGGQDGPGAASVAGPAFGEQQNQGFAVSVADRVELGVEPAPCASDTARKIPFLSRLAAAGRRVAPHQARTDDVDNARDHPPVVNPGHAARLVGKKRPKAGELSPGQPEMAVRHEASPVCWGLEPPHTPIEKTFVGPEPCPIDHFGEFIQHLQSIAAKH